MPPDASPPPCLPTADQLAVLTPRERWTFAVADFFVKHLRGWAAAWNSTFMVLLTWLATCRRLHVQGLEHLAPYDRRSRMLMVANHRSFFDFFQIMAVLYRRTGLGRRPLFPVRGTFFYDHPLGPTVNFLMSGMSMFPPILRRRAALPFNEYALDRCVAELRRPGTLVGIHPEGTRNKGDDPYKLLRASRGVGRVALMSLDTPVLPVFVLGAENNLLTEIKRNFLEPRRYPLFVVFGPPVDLQDLAERAEEPRAWKEAARRCVQSIEALGDQQKAMAGALSTDP